MVSPQKYVVLHPPHRLVHEDHSIFFLPATLCIQTIGTIPYVLYNDTRETKDAKIQRAIIIGKYPHITNTANTTTATVQNFHTDTNYSAIDFLIYN